MPLSESGAETVPTMLAIENIDSGQLLRLVPGHPEYEDDTH